MNSRQRRRQRRFGRAHFDAGVASGHDEVRRALSMRAPYGEWTAIEIIKHEVAGLARQWNAAEGRLALAKEDARKAKAKLAAADHEIRKLTEALKRQTPLVAELQIALRQIAQAASIVGTDPGPAAVADVPSVNELRQKVLAALKGPQ